MKNLTYHFEIQDMLIQFVAAFDDVVIGRFNKNRQEKEQIKVRYLHAPKQRVLLDIVNKAQNITLPVIAINATSISRDEERVFNKLEGFIHPPSKVNNEKTYSVDVPMPLPIDVSVSMSIIASFQSDIEQIISNFAPYCNPYVVISWRVPDAFGYDTVKEIRSTVLWDGSVALEYPVDIEASSKTRFIANTTFTIKGWLFPAAPAERVENIYFVDSNFRVSSKLELDRDNYSSFLNDQYKYDESSHLLNEIETVSISAVPQITNVLTTELTEISGYHILYPSPNNNTLILYGYNFDLTKNILLSSTSTKIITSLPLTSFDFVVDPYAPDMLDPAYDNPSDLSDTMFNHGPSSYYAPITARPLSSSNYTIVNKNIIKINLPQFTNYEPFNIILSNDVGWDSTINVNVQLEVIGVVFFHPVVVLTNNRYYWQSSNNWYLDADKTRKAVAYPNQHTRVTILCANNAWIDLDHPGYVNPYSINLINSNLTIYSNNSANFASIVYLDSTSTVTLTGNATFNK